MPEGRGFRSFIGVVFISVFPPLELSSVQVLQSLAALELSELEGLPTTCGRSSICPGLTAATFTLGGRLDSDLVFDSRMYPTVSSRHCEIIGDRFGHLLRDRSRHGTLLNDIPVNGQTSLHAGDSIRLGPNGPVLRFLGQSAEQRRLMTTA